MKNSTKNKISGFTRLVDFGDAILSRTKSASPKLTTGFTLVETLVALFIFSISVLTVMSALSSGISSTIYAKNKMTAEYLSQEGIEFFRNMRDTYALSEDTPATGWEKFLGKIAMCENYTGCYFDNDESSGAWNTTTEIEIFPCDETCANFLYEPSNGIFGIYSGNETVFSRKMLIERIDETYVKITSEVIWSSGSNTGSISLSEKLTNWIE